MTAGTPDWSQLNQRLLQHELVALRRHLAPDTAPTQQTSARNAESADAGDCTDSSLSQLCRIFGLTPFERGCLLLCAGMELDSAFATDCLATNPSGPTFGQAMALLPEAHWSAITPTAPLRHWRLLELDNPETPTRSRLRIDERILHYLVGIGYPDQRLQGFLLPLPQATPDETDDAAVLEQLLRHWDTSATASQWPHLYLRCPELQRAESVAMQLAAALDMPVSRIAVDDLPGDSAELAALARLLEREYLLGGGFVLLHAVSRQPGVGQFVLSRLIARVGVPLLIGGAPGSDVSATMSTRPLIQVDIPALGHAGQRRLWEAALGAAARRLNGQLDELVMQFALDPPGIRQIGTQLSRESGAQGIDPAALWRECRVQSRVGLARLAEPVQTSSTWDDLVLPANQLQVLRSISAQMRHRARVYEQWGFRNKDKRGLGISALFTGQSGTGKTMTADVLANDLDLDLYRIDLSQVVSKYIGETEKNLREVFDAAEHSGAVLLFDEADALFGKRSDIRDSHDRYANIEVSYLLQRMESYRGLAILTTNLKENLDAAFLRRLRFIVRFPFPDATQRAEIWRRILPRAMPRDNIDPERLAQLSLPGGNIRNIALNAAFLAAEAATPVTMQHLLQAARNEYAKLDRTINDSEIRGWQ